MHLQTVAMASNRIAQSSVAGFECPHCGDLMIAPEASMFSAQGEIFHHWICESCGQHTQTDVAFDE